LGETKCKTPEAFKASSQNLGHESVLTTFYSYGEVGQERQAEILNQLKTIDYSKSSSSNLVNRIAYLIKEHGVELI
jgi:hypothetical protein